MRKKILFYMYIYAALTFARTLECGSKMRAFLALEIVSFPPKAQRIFCAFFFPPKKRSKICTQFKFFSPISKIFWGKAQKISKAILSYTHTYMHEFCLLLYFFLSPFPCSIYFHSIRSLIRSHSYCGENFIVK